MGEFFLGIMEITIGMSILILLMLFTLKLIGGKFTAKCRYILWTLVMIRLAVPLSFGILPALIEVPVETEPVQQIQMQVPTVDYTPTQQNPITVQPQEQVQIPTPTVQTPVFTESEPDPLTWEDVKAYIPHAYLTGAAVFLLWNLLAYGIYTAKILRSAREADDETQAIYEAVCRKKGLRSIPKLLVSPDVNSPAAFGLLYRRIVLPDIALTENGLTGTLSHEVTHCKRGDLWIKAVCLLARSLHWFNPLVHLAAFRCEMEMELSCDESVLAGCDENTRAAYGEVMLDIIKRCRRNRGALTTHFNPKKNAVKARFTNILYGSGKKRGLWLIAVCLVLCLIAGAIVACRTEDVTAEENEDEIIQEDETEILGEYVSVEAYVTDRMAQETTISYTSNSLYNEFPDGGFTAWTANANVIDTKLIQSEKKGELDGLAPDGILECWEYRYYVKLDVPAEDVMTVDGDFDGWFDMVGQHSIMALLYPDGTYSVLRDAMVGDGIDFSAYHDTYEEAIYDWYVTEYGIDLPLYVEDWTDKITTPNGEYIGNHPVHRFDGDGWGIYIPIAAWYQATDVGEKQWRWCSSYLTGSELMVEAFSGTMETGTPVNTQTDGTYRFTYEYANPNGGFWRVTITWTEEGITDYPYIAIEPQLLKLMAESFVVFGETYNEVPISPTVEDYADADAETIWQNFLDTVVSPYSDYIVTHEFLDLDGNGIDELIIYNWGASASCGIEIFTIENGEVRSFSTTTNGITYYSGEAKSLATASVNAVDYSFWGLPTSYSDRSDTILWFTPCTGRNGHVLYSMNGSDVHTSEDYYYFTSDANGNLTVEVLRSFRCEAIDSNPANGWKCYINGEETNVRGFRDTMLFFWQDLAVTHGVQYHDKNTASRYDELEAWMEPPLDVGALLEKNLEELRQMKGNQYRAIEAILSQNSSMLEEAMKLPERTGQMFTGITLASWEVDRISDDRYFNPIRLTLEITESSSSVFPVGISTWIVDEGMDGVTLTNYENPVVRNTDPTTDAEETVWTWLRATGQVILPLNTEMTAEKTAEFAKYATEYACRHADGTLDSIRNMVKTCFGSEEYFSDEILYTGDGVHYGAGAHGAARHSYDWLGTTENKDGSISVKMLFYADPSKFIPAKTVEYTLIPTGEDSYGQTVYFFRSCEIVEDTGYSAYFKWT